MFTIGEFADKLGFQAVGNLAHRIDGVAHPCEARATDLALALKAAYLPLIRAGAARAAMTPPGVEPGDYGLLAVVHAPRARYALHRATTLFAPKTPAPPGRHPSAVVDSSAKIGAGVSIGPQCLIEADAEIGEGSVLVGQCLIGRGARLGPGALVKHGARIAAGCRIGARLILHENAVIGADGFSFVTPEPGSVESARASGAVTEGAENLVWARIHSLAPVIVGDDVEIGANTTVDRGTVAATRIGSGVKIDNQVQIGHNVRIGENCLICGQVGVAGSVEIGDRVVLGGQVGVADQAKIGSDVVAMARAGIQGVVAPRSVVGGFPAMDRAALRAAMRAQQRLPRLIKDVDALKKRFSSEQPSG